MAFPYTLISCPCKAEEQAGSLESLEQHRRASHHPQLQEPDDAEAVETEPLDPFDPRASFTLHHYDRLLYCDDCQQIRCPKCWSDEINRIYCPSCLYKVPSSTVKSDGNRCTRCFDCPLCFSNLSITASPAATPAQSYFLKCPFCDWSSLHLGISLDRPTHVTEQLTALERARHTESPSKSGLVNDQSPNEPNTGTTKTATLSRADLFANLTSFYEEQIEVAELNDSRINQRVAQVLRHYSRVTPANLERARQRPQPMKEAINAAQGLVVTSPAGNEQQIIDRLRNIMYSETTTLTQRESHPWNRDARLIRDLWPIPTKLRTSTTKRCRTCRNLLTSRHDDLSGPRKYKLRWLAKERIPGLKLRLFTPTSSSSRTDPPSIAIERATTSAAYAAARLSSEYDLQPHKPVQYLLTLVNPLFEPVRITLATPATTPGPIATRVTILCPSFEIGPNPSSSSWIDSSIASSSLSTATSLKTLSTSASASASDPASANRQPEPGKVWEKDRNWVRVVIEVVPGSIGPAATSSSGGVNARSGDGGGSDGGDGQAINTKGLVEIPIHVRVEWEASASETDLGTTGKKEPRELGFWSVLGAGRIVA